MISVDDLPSPVFVSDLDFKVLRVNHELLSVIGMRDDDLLGKPLKVILPPVSQIFVETHLRPMVLAGSDLAEVYLQLRHVSGSRIPVMVNCRRGHFGERDCLVWTLFVARERARFEEELLAARNRADQAARRLSEQHELLVTTLASIAEGVVTTDTKGCVTWLNPVAERLTGWTLEQARSRPVDQVFKLVNQPNRAAHPGLWLPDGASFQRLVSLDGLYFDVEYSIAPINGDGPEPLGKVLVFRDVSEQRRLSGEMAYQATHDTLTGLLNRKAFESHLAHLMSEQDDPDRHHVLLFIDLDRFKAVNDSCGHAAGDILLRQIASLINQPTRKRDVVARIGGDEFAVVLQDCSREKGLQLARRICERVEQYRFMHDGKPYQIGASIGLVELDDRWPSSEAAIRAADMACYAAKQAGRNRVEIWRESEGGMQVRAAEMMMTSRISQSLDNGAFSLFVQRILPLSANETIMRGEVLVRMDASDGVLLAPSHFLPVAERFHLLGRIDRLVLGRTVEWLKGMAGFATGQMVLSVNISGQSLADAGFREWVANLLASAGREVVSSLCLEITEVSALSGIADAIQFCERVRQAGGRIAIDDFGNGAASFGYLNSMAVDFLKIDGRFTAGLVDSPLDQAMVRCFRDIGKALGLATIAEQVDRASNLEMLRSIGIDFAQGYLLHRPEPLQGFMAPRVREAG